MRGGCSVRNAAHAAGLSYKQLPPGSQSLNDAETAINYIQENALAHMAQSNLPHRVIGDVLWETAYIWNRSAKATRWDRTPYDLLGKGRTPDGEYVKPSRAYDVAIGSYGAIHKIVKKQPSPGISIFVGDDPLPGNRGLVCRFIRHASMWDGTGSTHKVLLHDRVTRTGALIKRTSRNVVYENPDFPWYKVERERRPDAAPATLPWAEHADGKRYRREQLQLSDVPPPPPPLSGAEPEEAGTEPSSPTPGQSSSSEEEVSPAPSPGATRRNPPRNRQQPDRFTRYRQEHRSVQHQQADRAAKAGGGTSGSTNASTNWSSDGSSEGEDRHDGRESPGGTTVEVPSAASLPFVTDPTNEMQIVHRELASRKRLAQAAQDSKQPPTSGVRFKGLGRQGDSSGSSDEESSDGGAPTAHDADGDGVDEGTSGGTNADMSGQQPTPSELQDVPVHQVVPTHVSNMATRTAEMESALATGNMDGFSSLVQSIAVCEVEELVAETGPLDPSKIGHSASQHVAHILGLRSVNRVKQKKNSNADLQWRAYLENPGTREEVLQAYDAEVEGLLRTIFTELQPDDPEYAIALERGTRSRPILSKKRSGKFKSRVVKLGHLEDKVQEDGMYFNYCAHVTSLKNIRMILSMNMKGKSVAVIDVSQAFLQANAYEDGKVKFTYFTDKRTGQKRVFRSSGPQYGEASAPVRWLDTLKEFMAEIGMEQCKNEPATFRNKATGLIVAAYVDDLTIVASRAVVQEFLDALMARFACKDPEWLAPGTPIDLLGMELSIQDVDGIPSLIISMESYIDALLESLAVQLDPKVKTPLEQAIHCCCVDGLKCKRCWTHRRATKKQRAHFMTATGSVGWLVATARPDLMACHVRLSQHMANPTVGAIAAINRVLQYVANTKTLCLTVPLDNEIPDGTWKYYSDSDFAGNKELHNHLRAQCCSMAFHRGVPVFWRAGVSKSCFATADLGEAHVDRSSGAAEVYGAGEATTNLLPLKYVATELGIPVPLPMVLQLDASTAVAFMNGTVRRSKLAHIDNNQEWVILMRDKGLFRGEWIPGRENLADVGTKLQGSQLFCPLVTEMLTPVARVSVGGT